MGKGSTPRAPGFSPSKGSVDVSSSHGFLTGSVVSPSGLFNPPFTLFYYTVKFLSWFRQS